MKHNLIKTDNYLLVVDDSEIKEGDWIKWDNKVSRAIDTTYLPSTKKIISHAPLNGASYLDGVDRLPPNWRDSGEEESETNFAEVFYRLLKNTYPTFEEWPEAIEYRKQSREKYKFTEEDLRKGIKMGIQKHPYAFDGKETKYKYSEDEIIQSLQQHKLPIAFECEMEPVVAIDKSGYPTLGTCVPKTITNAEGRTEWVGKYIYE